MLCLRLLLRDLLTVRRKPCPEQVPHEARINTVVGTSKEPKKHALPTSSKEQLRSGKKVMMTRVFLPNATGGFGSDQEFLAQRLSTGRRADNQYPTIKQRRCGREELLAQLADRDAFLLFLLSLPISDTPSLYLYTELDSILVTKVLYGCSLQPSCTFCILNSHA